MADNGDATGSNACFVTDDGADATDREVLVCLAASMAQQQPNDHFARSVLLVYAAGLVFFMQAGFAMVCAGGVRKKNVQNTMLKNFLDACGASLAFFCVGYAFAFGSSDAESTRKSFVGHSNFFLVGVDDFPFWLFNFAFSAASATIVAGTLAERCQMAAYLCYSFMLSGWVYPIVARAVWSANGILSATNLEPLWGVGMVDFAGSGVVHVTGGMTALLATIILGPRRGRFHDETGRVLEVPKEFPGHSAALQMLGTFILWFGWYGFNGGSALLFETDRAYKLVALAAINTTLAAGSAGLVALFVQLWYNERMTGEISFNLTFLMNGSLAGLVAITGGCGVVEPWAAVVIGMVAGLVLFLGSTLLVRLRLDDAVDAIPVHCFSGILGVLAVGLFASPRWLEVAYGHARHPGWFYDPEDGTLLGAQCVGLLFIIVWVTGIMLPFFIWLDWKGWFRSDPLEELVGLDTSYHGGLALLNRGEDRVNPEYISALKERRDKKEARVVGVNMMMQDTGDDQTGDIFQTATDENDELDGQNANGEEEASYYGMVSL